MMLKADLKLLIACLIHDFSSSGYVLSFQCFKGITAGTLDSTLALGMNAERLDISAA